MAHTDPRYALREAHDWVADLVDGTAPEQLDRPTPCEGWNVTQLLGHLLSGLARVQVMGQGGDPSAVPVPEQAPAEGWGPAFREAVEDLWAVWDNDELLERTFHAPWGEVTGAQFLGGQTMETVAHGWDLAVATGQNSEAPGQLAEQALATAQVALPVGRAQRPFGEPVPSAPDAGPTERLANWLGRARHAA